MLTFSDTMAKTPENAIRLMESVWKHAVARVHQEVADMQKIADGEGAGKEKKKDEQNKKTENKKMES